MTGLTMETMLFHRLSTFEPTCNATCDCDRNKFSPICGADGRTYFSACHAGCSNYTVADGKVASVSNLSYR